MSVKTRENEKCGEICDITKCRTALPVPTSGREERKEQAAASIPTSGRQSRKEQAAVPSRPRWRHDPNATLPTDEQASQLEIPFLWIEKAVLTRLARCIAVIDKIPLKLETHPAWAETRTEVCSAVDAIVELRRAAYQMLGVNSRLAICHVKSKTEPKTKPR